ncbi:MAG: signal peptide peptidase SppA [Gammaproteobacteria bacterium]|nr:signal peptide peptidase SppA [Gammaproteobacteria bacterium]
MLLILGLIIAGLAETEPSIPPSAVLVVSPSGVLVDQLKGDPLEHAIAEAQGTGIQQTLLTDITDSLHAAADDERIKAVVLELDGLAGGGLAKLQTFAAALGKVRDAGKPIIAIGDGYTQDQYYLAAFADEIYLHDLGVVYIDGYGYYRTYLKGVIEKLNIDLNVFRVGKYKSFVEPFIRDDMSAADREASQRWLDALWSAYKNDVSTARQLESGHLDNYANRFIDNLREAGGNTAQMALATGLVDSVAGRGAARERLIELAGPDADDDSTYSSIDFLSYVSRVRAKQVDQPGAPKVAVLVAAGEIVDGEAPRGMIGGDSLSVLIDQAADDEQIKALVLRIDSPGGSMFASEVVLEQLAQLKLLGKPLVVSMSSVAASGGYYIAMLADQIWARETTITGSIGVGALMPTFQRSLDGIGVHIDGIGTTQLSGQFRPDRELGEQARQFLQLSVEEAYRIFVSKVADARGISFERADNLAQGRVWVGSDALAIGLVDEIGGLDDAIRSAADLAGLAEETYSVQTIEPELTFSERIASEFSGKVVSFIGAFGIRFDNGWTGSWAESFVLRLEQEFGQLGSLNDPRGIYYHCFCVLP